MRIITADAKEGKLIFSERTGNEAEEKASLIDKYQVGDTAEGEVTGVVDFGVFVKLETGLEGLVHISELDWGLVEDPHMFCNVGDKVRVKVIEIKDGKISLYQSVEGESLAYRRRALRKRYGGSGRCH